MSTERSMIGTLTHATHYVGWALVALGVVAAVAPVATGAALVMVLGLILLVAAALIGAFGWRAREAGKGPTLLVVAALAAIAGLLLVVQPTAGLSLARLLLIAYFLLSGVSEIATGWELRGEEGWTSMLVAGGISILSAAVLWTDWPISGARALGLLVGVKVASVGWAVVRVARRVDTVGERVAAARTRFR